MTTWITSEDELAAHYGTPKRASTVKVTPVITPHYRAYIDAAPFCAIASIGPEGLDCSPRGDDGSVVSVIDETTLALPDRRGNDRIDTLRNIVRDPRVSLMFLIPGSNTVIRVNGTARITADEEVCARFTKDGSAPRSVIFIAVGEVYFQCKRALLRARFWEGGLADAAELPTPGEILEALSRQEFEASSYDQAWADRAAKTMW